MSISSIDFERCFECLTGNRPFPWQTRLHGHFLKGDSPPAIDLPTGLGKTATIAVWLLALAQHARAGTVGDFPRRLVYVVNRRTVVDQATHEAEQMRSALVSAPELSIAADALRALAAHSTEIPLAISTLRGQFADNTEWRDDPARAAVIVGTVDMIGSRLLFSGYGRGFKSRPLHAGFLGQDTLLVHDEAHLEPAFQELIAAIESEQQRRKEFRRFRVMALTATSRGDSGQFGLTDADTKHTVVRKRINAKKGVSLHRIDNEKDMADQVVKLALQHEDSKHAILIFLRKLEDVHRVVGKLPQGRVQTLTGTMRGLERDSLSKEDAIFARFIPKPEIAPQRGTVYLICTSAGEVGVNISADHLVCDLTPFDSMAQRFGRVNRFGDGDARIDVVYCASRNVDPNSQTEMVSDAKAEGKATPPSPFDQACERTLLLLQQLPKREDQRHDASPAALGALPVADRQTAFTPPPAILPASDILFDAWALTSVRQKLPGRPPVADWLHGVAEWEPPETHVAWRKEVGYLTDELRPRYKPEDLLEDYPLKPHELLRDRSDRVFEHLKKLAEAHADCPVWLVVDGESVIVKSLGELAKGDKDLLIGRTVLLPPEVGALLESGMLSGTAAFDEHRQYDVADRWNDEKGNPRRLRAWDNAPAPDGMRLVRTIDIRPDADDEQDQDKESTSRRYWHWYVRPRSADDDGSRTARTKQELVPHLQSAERFAAVLAAKLLGESNEARAVTLAAKWHDFGKRRSIWQRSIGNRDPNLVLAKSGGKAGPIEITDYRHELGSLIDVSSNSEFRQLTPEMQELVLHLIAAHHGRARPYFPANEAFDPERSEEHTAEIVREVPRRFARLQRKYGHWGLAYLESLVRAADALASQNDPESTLADSPAVSFQEAAR
ncbi:MAG TPA: type I-U CRISPR-associated helicase/endonuclease Cas3 [Burkholderiales bacterium]|nr:type I-U CRISPR-associated helicase/endonuclease Cas3 [Burkholderiales bacterium]